MDVWKTAFLDEAEILLNYVRKYNMIQDGKAEEKRPERVSAEGIGWLGQG